MNPVFIAEIKPLSPYGFKSAYSKCRLTNCALEHGDWVSVHTSPLYGGSFDDIHQVRKLTDKPILAKGYHAHDDDIRRAFDLGADYALVVNRMSSLASLYKRLLFEVDLETLNYISDFNVVYNGRDLRTGIGKKSIGDYHEYRKRLKWVCGASLIKTPDEVELFYPGCDAFIVGSNLVEFCKEKK